MLGVHIINIFFTCAASTSRGFFFGYFCYDTRAPYRNAIDTAEKPSTEQIKKNKYARHQTCGMWRNTEHPIQYRSEKKSKSEQKSHEINLSLLLPVIIMLCFFLFNMTFYATCLLILILKTRVFVCVCVECALTYTRGKQ